MAARIRPDHPVGQLRQHIRKADQRRYEILIPPQR
jgi:hypothetical protein